MGQESQWPAQEGEPNLLAPSRRSPWSGACHAVDAQRALAPPTISSSSAGHPGHWQNECRPGGQERKPFALTNSALISSSPRDGILFPCFRSLHGHGYEKCRITFLRALGQQQFPGDRSFSNRPLIYARSWIFATDGSAAAACRSKDSDYFQFCED